MSASSEEWINQAPLTERLKSWIKTTRIQTAMVTALAIWIGYITVSPLMIRDVIILGIIGILVHIWGFTLNEVEDYKYDKVHDDVEGHLIAQGKVHAGSARMLAWISAALAIGLIAVSGANIYSVLTLAISFVPGYAYDKFSKEHWWSNGYLSAWSILMVLTGALYAGKPTIYTGLIAVAVGIQIFVQVIQGDLKDLRGSECTFAGVCGVNLTDVANQSIIPSGKNGNSVTMNKSDSNFVSYSKTFISIVYGMKFLEVAVILMVVAMTLEVTTIASKLWATIALIVGVIFIGTASAFLVYVYDRDTIKKKSSTHELVSILLLGLGVFELDPRGALIIIFVPIIWYVGTNFVLHSSALNPDV